MSPRGWALTASLVAVFACAALLLSLGGRPGSVVAPAASASGAPSAAAADIAAAVLNINGDLPQGRIAGTGMIIAADGVALTNNHVVAGTVNLTAQVAGVGRVYRATVLGVDPTHDVAVIRLEGASGLPTVPIDTSGVVNAGDRVTGMGNALGNNGAPVLASGVVTSLDETLTVTGEGDGTQNTLNGLIQFNAPIQPGDSGGPLLNAAGFVIGMDTAGSLPNSVPAGGRFGAAIPITTAMTVAHDILSGVTSAYIQSGHSGVLGVATTDAAGVDGAYVSSTTAGDAAALAGIVAGDVITGVGAVAIHSVADLHAATAGRRPGEHIRVAWREVSGALHQATVALSPGPPA